MSNWAKNIPRGDKTSDMQGFPAPFKAQARFYRENGSTSSIQTLTDNTTQIEVGVSGPAGPGGALIRWIPATETAAAPAGSVLATNFDHYIPNGTLRYFVVPKETQGVTSTVGTNVQNGLYKRVAITTVGPVASVVTTEY